MKNTQRQLSFISLEEYEREAIDFLREHEPPEGYFVGFSGGKDSIVTLKLCQLSGVKHQAFYSCTGIDEPSVVRFIKANYPYVTWLKPKIDFWHGIKKNGVPLIKQRWCCNLLKKDPAKDIPLKMRVMGIRAEESTKRASRPRIDDIKKYKYIHVKPIFNWKEFHVWEFIEKYNLPYPSLYDEGVSRIGCVICPFMFRNSQNAQKVLHKQRKKYKGIYEKFERCAYEYWKNKHNENMEDFKEFINDYYHGFTQSKTDDEKQNTLFPE